ncbi:hypothetical protein [Desulfovibrio sp.]
MRGNMLAALVFWCMMFLAQGVAAGDTEHWFDEHDFKDVRGDFTGSETTDAELDARLFVLPWLTLEKTSEREVLDRFGPAPSRPGREDRFSHCYVESGSGVAALPAGRGDTVIQVTLADSTRRLRHPEACASVPAGSFPAAGADGLRLGMTRDEVVRLLGEPLHEDARRLYYACNALIPLTEAEKQRQRAMHPTFPAGDSYFSSERSVTVRLDRGRVFSFTLRSNTAAPGFAGL